jgi:nucleotide-binding universal stress UspA family protein
MDYRAMTRDLLVRAKQVAEIFGSRLSIVSAIPDVRPSTLDGDHKSARPMRREAAANIEIMLSALSIEAAVAVLEGSVGEVVREEALMDDADLIVIGEGHLDEPMGHLRTHAYEIIWNAPCPVLKV